MAGSVNKVILLGNLGRDPEVRYTQDNRKIVNLRIATSERWKDRMSGEQKERTEWHSVVIFNPNLADIAERYLRKGSSVYLEGSLQTRKWQDQQGQDRYSTEVVLGQIGAQLVLLGGRDGGGAAADPLGDYGEDRPAMERSGGGPRGGGARSGPASGGGREARDELDDEIPF